MPATAEAPPLLIEQGTRPDHVPFAITSEMFQRMVEEGMFPKDARVYLWGGRIYDRMAKSMPHGAVHGAFNTALARRVPGGYLIGPENPVRLDETHLPLPDLIVARGWALDYYDSRYPDGRDVLLVVEIAMTSLGKDLGIRLARYAATLPEAVYIVAHIPHRRILVHTDPRPAEGDRPAGFASVATVGPGETLRLRIGDVELAPIPYEEVMR